MEKMLTVKKVAKMLGVTTYTVRGWAKNGKIKAVKIPEGSEKSQWFISEQELERMRGINK